MAGPVRTPTSRRGCDDKGTIVRADGAFPVSGLTFAAQKVPVEAEGAGATRLEALRSAVGMFMVGTTQLSDDTVNEVIATYSRGGRSSGRRRTPCSRRRSWRSNGTLFIV